MTEPFSRTGQLHYHLIRSILEFGFAPSLDDLCSKLGIQTQDELKTVLDELATQHGVVLHPASHEVWVIHPFSLSPTAFVVESKGKKWWGCCAWCSMGIAALLDAPCRLRTTFGAEGESVTLDFRDGVMNPSDIVVHFPIPMRNAWDNVIYTCSTMLLFRNENEVDDWCLRHKISKGDVQPVQSVFDLAKRWYGSHLDPNWKKKSIDEARSLFAEIGFTHLVWDLPSGEERF